MTIASFCQDELLAHGPLTLDELVARAVSAEVTRARNPHASLLSVIRYRELELLDGRWVTPLWLLEGRCLTATHLPYRRSVFSEVDADLSLLGNQVPLESTPYSVGDDSKVHCVRVQDGTVDVTSIPRPELDTLEVAELAARLSASTPHDSPHGERQRSALRAVAQLMVDDPATFRTPLPPLSTWVPALVEEAREREEEERRMAEWWEQDERRRMSRLELDDCTAIEVELAAARSRVSVREWLLTAVDRALQADRQQSTAERGPVITLGDRWR